MKFSQKTSGNKTAQRFCMSSQANLVRRKEPKLTKSVETDDQQAYDSKIWPSSQKFNSFKQYSL